jgi:hypothetical protein
MSDAARPSPWRRRFKRGAIGCGIAVPVLVLALWFAVHTFPSVGPAIADGLRWAIGPERVSRLEDFVYGVEDSFNQWWRADEAPKAYWEVPTTTATTSAPVSGSAAPDRPQLPPFAPSDVGPVHKGIAAKGDGVWVPVVDPARPGAPVAVKKTLVHPDAKRPWAELFVIAVDLRAIELHLVAGTAEPKATTREGRGYQRTGVIPAKHHDALFIAFNGGFKMTHGRWGMRIDDVTLLPPRRHGCAVLKLAEAELQIHPYMGTDEDEKLLSKAEWWRQTPPCMFHEGKRHGGLWDPDSKNWGAALGGDTVIRRSAIGLDDARKILFMGVSNHTAAQVMANGMHHVGASDVAQLDVNWSFPKIVIFRRSGGTPVGEPLFQGFKVEEGEYISEASPRDFFYLTRRELGDG